MCESEDPLSSGQLHTKEQGSPNADPTVQEHLELPLASRKDGHSSKNIDVGSGELLPAQAEPSSAAAVENTRYSPRSPKDQVVDAKQSMEVLNK